MLSRRDGFCRVGRKLPTEEEESDYFQQRI